MLMRLCGFASVPLCGFCRVLFDAHLFVCADLTLVRRPGRRVLCSGAVVDVRSILKYTPGIARIGSSSRSPQRGVVSSSARPSMSPCASAATLVVAFVMLAALAFVYPATACGLSGPAGGSCLQPVGAATLAALRAASFVFVLLFFVMRELAGVHSLCGTDVLKIFYVFTDGLFALASVYCV